MSSGRGPGVIGMVMALIVLIGFGLLFTFAFDEGFQGGRQSIESVISHQAREIESCQSSIVASQKALEQGPTRIANSKEMVRLKIGNRRLQDSIVTTRNRVESVKAQIATATETFDLYKDEYRAFARGKAKGETMETLETRSGGVYKNVTIREVTAIGIQIRHGDGQKRIPFEDLPDAMKDHFQFDPKQKEQAVASELVVRNEHDAAVAVADGLADAQMAKQRALDADAARERIRRDIAIKQALIISLDGEIKNLELERERAAADANAARAAGRMFIDRGGNIGGDIRSKQNRIAALQAEVGQMMSRL